MVPVQGELCLLEPDLLREPAPLALGRTPANLPGFTHEVEHRGGDRFSNDDAREMRDIGAVWAAASGGRWLFLMATDQQTAGRPVRAQLRAVIEGAP